MREDLVSILRCPRCRTGALDLTVERRLGGEVVEGILRCPECGGQFPVQGGIADLLEPVGPVVASEREVYRRSREEVWKRLRVEPPEVQRERLRRIAFMEHTSEEFRLTSTLNLEGVLRRVRPRRGEWLWELGAGSGWLTATWASLGLRCVAVDISADLKLELSPLVMEERQVYFDRVMADMANLPLRDASVHWVFASASLHHAQDLGRSLREASRVLVPGGTLVVINEPMHGLLRRSGKRFVDEAAREHPGLHEQSFPYAAWRKALAATGLSWEFFFPAYYEKVLSGEVQAGDKGWVRLARMVGPGRLARLLRVRPLMTLVQWLLGLNVCLVATRDRR